MTIIRQPGGRIGRIRLASLRVGQTYDLGEDIARALILEGQAREERRRTSGRRRAPILAVAVAMIDEGAMNRKPPKRRPPTEPLEKLSGKFAYRKCQVCEWEGQLPYSTRGEPDCPACHAPTDLVAVLQPMSQSDSLQKNPHAAALGRLGGQRGGPARAAMLSPKRRRDIARKAALARWSGKRDK